MADDEQGSELECPVCGSTSFREDTKTAELVCRECGTVIMDQMVDESSGPRAFTAEEREKKERTGAPITYTKADKGMVTEIGRGNMSQVSPEKRSQYYRMQKWQRRLDESRQRRMKFALGELERLTGVLNLPDSVREEASRLYEKALEEDVVKGRNIDNIVAALVYIVARNQGLPRTLSEISREAGIEDRELGKAYRHVARELDLGIVPVDPEDMLPRFAGKLGLSGETQALAREIIMEAKDEGLLAGRSPDGVVASALYISSKLEGEETPQKDIARAVGVTEVTVRKGYRHIVEGLDMEEELERRA